MSKPKFRRPQPEEQHLLDHLSVRLLLPKERARYAALMVEHHYLHAHHLVGEQLCYVVTYRGQWLALASWCAAARYLKARDQFIGWTPEQCRRRRALIANNARLLILPGVHYPNLASRALKLLLARLADDWQQRYGHPVVLVESFVDPQQFRGTTYKCSGWSELGRTQGWGRCGQDFYVKHERPKQLWVKELVPKACPKLRAESLPGAWAGVETTVAPRCNAKTHELKALTDHLARVPEFRSAHSLAYPLPGLLALVAVASFCGVARGKKDLAAFAATLSQSQLRALRFRRDRHTGALRQPGSTTFFRLLNEVDEAALEAALLAWQDQVLGPIPDRLIAVDGKKLRHSQGGELVSAAGAQSGRWLGTVRTPDKTNEIPAARVLLEQVQQRMDLSGKVVVLDALHTQDETARQIVQELGADYLFTVKENQKGLHDTLRELESGHAFSPSGSNAHGPTTRTQSGPTRTAPATLAAHDARTSGLCRGQPDRNVADRDPGKRPVAAQAVAPDHQRGPAALASQGAAGRSARLLEH